MGQESGWDFPWLLIRAQILGLGERGDEKDNR